MIKWLGLKILVQPHSQLSPIGINKENDKATVMHEQEDEIMMRAIAVSLEVIETREGGLPFIKQSESGEFEQS